MEVRIYYEDTDCGGVVYYANYLKYFERARTHFLEERGLSVVELLKQGTQFLVVHAELDYRRPARYGQTLTIDTELSGHGKASLTFTHVIRERDSKQVIVEGSATLVTTDLQGKVQRLAPALVRALQSHPRTRPKSKRQKSKVSDFGLST